MLSLYIAFVISVDLLVILFGLLFGAFPGVWYKWHITQIQLAISISMCIFSGYSYLYTKICTEELFIKGSTFDTEITSMLVVFSVAILLISIYKYNERKKMITGKPIQSIELKKEDYEMVKHITLEDTTTNIPIVNAYAIFGENVMLFEAGFPKKEVDGEFICRKFDENLYVCEAYVDKNPNRDFKSAIHKMSVYLAYLAVAFGPILWCCNDNHRITWGYNIEGIQGLDYFIVLFATGMAFKHCTIYVPKCFSKIYYWFSILIIIISFTYLFTFFFPFS